MKSDISPAIHGARISPFDTEKLIAKVYSLEDNQRIEGVKTTPILSASQRDDIRRVRWVDEEKIKNRVAKGKYRKLLAAIAAASKQRRQG